MSDRRESLIDRRSLENRRKVHDDYYRIYVWSDRRCWKERRSEMERRSDWKRVSRWSSICMGELKIHDHLNSCSYRR